MIDEDARDRIIAELIEVEGGFVDHPDDPGGRTIHGVSEENFPEVWADAAPGYPSLAACVAVYIDEFWNVMRLSKLESELVAGEMMEAAVNMGPVQGVKFAQEAYNLLIPDGWPVLVEDGYTGPHTFRALNRFSAHSPKYEAALFNTQNVLQGVEYLYSKNAAMRRGWMANRIRGISA